MFEARLVSDAHTRGETARCRETRRRGTHEGAKAGYVCVCGVSTEKNMLELGMSLYVFGYFMIGYDWR